MKILKRHKKSFRQRFKEASVAGKILLILKCLAMIPLFFLLLPNEGRKIGYKVELGNHVTYDEKTGETLSVYRPQDNIFKDAYH